MKAIQQQPDENDAVLDRQTVLARFGELALRSESLDDILTEACRLVGKAFGTDLAKVMELQHDGKTLLVKAGIGWRPGIVGETRVEALEGSSEGYAIATGEPAISFDISQETRFEYPDFLKEHGVQAVVNVLIIGADSEPPYGILQVDSRQPRRFDGDDVQFLRAYANLLAAAVTRLRMLAELRDRADEKDRLLRELQHRVKNNLQTMVGLVQTRLRRARHPEAQGELRTIAEGIEALRLAHEKIYNAGDGTGTVNLGTYLGELGASLLRFHSRAVQAKVRLVAEVDHIEVLPDQAIPLGLIVNEFVTNSLKYAFGNGRGVIGLRVEEVGSNEVHVTLWDNGKGLPVSPSGGTGMRLINSLARQVGATPEWGGDTGARLTLAVRVRPVLVSPSGYEP